MDWREDDERKLGSRESQKTPELGSCVNLCRARLGSTQEITKSPPTARDRPVLPLHRISSFPSPASPRIRPRPRPPPLLPPLPAAFRRRRRRLVAASRTRTAVAGDDDPMTMMTPPPLEVRALLHSLARSPRSPRPVHPRCRADRGRSGSRQGLRAGPDLTPQPALFPPRSSSRRTTRCWCRTRSSLLLARKPPRSRWKVRT